MNTEQLEASLRSEIDGYVQSMREQMSQEINQLQSAVEEISRQNEVLSEKVKQLKDNVTPEKAAVAPEFSEVLTEHLRLAREEGAKIVTDAMSNVQEEPSKDLTTMRDAVSEISTQTSQSEILKSLLNYVSHFAPRGTFFIVKSENLVGWRSFGDRQDEDSVREAQMPIAADTILGAAVRNGLVQRSIYGSHSEDRKFLDHLEYGKPHQMMALPLVVRGRGVAVLYVDGGTEGATVKIDALEALMRVAGLTVELLASARTVARQSVSAESEKSSVESAPPVVAAETSPVEEPSPAHQEAAENTLQYEVAQNSYAEQVMPSFENSAPLVADNYPPPLTFDQPLTDNYAETPVEVSANSAANTESESFASESFSFEKPAESFERMGTGALDRYASPTDFNDYRFQPEAAEAATAKGYDNFSFAGSEAAPQETVATDFSPQAFDTKFAPAIETSSANRFSETVVEEAAPAPVESVAPVAESKPAPPRRFGERNVELPIEVPEEEKRSHNDARRFARLLVSEIKLYNEQRVKEGRQSSDIYERLSEAIDRSREMYDKRVNPTVSTKFDYFHYELVNTLAEGDDAKMGAKYPGATV